MLHLVGLSTHQQPQLFIAFPNTSYYYPLYQLNFASLSLIDMHRSIKRIFLLLNIIFYFFRPDVMRILIFWISPIVSCPRSKTALPKLNVHPSSHKNVWSVPFSLGLSPPFPILHRKMESDPISERFCLFF